MTKRQSPIRYTDARDLLDRRFREVEKRHLEGKPLPGCPPLLTDPLNKLFASETQAHREVLVGCIVARIQDRQINIRHPYMNHGDDAFNGRTLDERVVNPFLRENRIPCTKGPYLSAYRRSVKLEASTSGGLRDPGAFNALLECVSFLESTNEEDFLLEFLDCVMCCFIKLRESSRVDVIPIDRLSLEQYVEVVRRMLALKSGGRVPVFVTAAVLTAYDRHHALGWDISWQGINVADAASDAVGDVTIKRDGKIILAAEVTERIVDQNRVVSTFRTKIVDVHPEQYVFFAKPSDDSRALEQARQYFAQGYEIDFADLLSWARNILLTIGPSGRRKFGRALVEIVQSDDTPGAIKSSWNTIISDVLAGRLPE